MVDRRTSRSSVRSDFVPTTTIGTRCEEADRGQYHVCDDGMTSATYGLFAAFDAVDLVAQLLDLLQTRFLREAAVHGNARPGKQARTCVSILRSEPQRHEIQAVCVPEDEKEAPGSGDILFRDGSELHIGYLGQQTA